MNEQEYSERLKKETSRENLIELLVCCFLGLLCLGISIIGILDLLPISVYGEDMDQGSKSFLKVIFWAIGVFGLFAIGVAIKTAILRWLRKDASDIYDDHLI